MNSKMKTFKEYLNEQNIGVFTFDSAVKNTNTGNSVVTMIKNKGKPNSQEYRFEVWKNCVIDVYVWDTSEEDYVWDISENIFAHAPNLKKAVVKFAKNAK